MAKISVNVTFETITPLWTGDAWGETITFLRTNSTRRKKIIPIPKFNFKENTPQMESCNLYLHIGGKIISGPNPKGKLILGKIEKI